MIRIAAAVAAVVVLGAAVWHWRVTSRQWRQGQRYAEANPYLRAIDLSLRGAT